MNLSQKIVRLGDVLYTEGWVFILPYLVLYLSGLWLALPTRSLLYPFWALHLANFCVWAVWISHTRPSQVGQRWFWLVLLAVFFITGNYLEFPTDPWEHFRRIFLWGNTDPLSKYPFPHKFAYYFDWTWVEWVPLRSRRLALDAVGAFWQFLLLYALDRFLQRVEIEGYVRRLAVIAVIGLFGTSVFSFRYYALSSTPVAYVVYLRFLGLLAESPLVSRAQRDLSWWLRASAIALSTLFVMYFNHQQEVILSGVAVVAAGLVWVLRRSWITIAVLALTTLFLGLFGAFRAAEFLQFFPARNWARAIGFSGNLLEKFAPDLNRLHQVPVWAYPSQYTDTIGMVGIFSLLAAVALFRRQRFLAALTIVPVTLLLYPPFLLIILSFISVGNIYRILFAFPYAVLIAIGIDAVVRRAADGWKAKGYRQYLSFAILAVVLALAPLRHPWRNRTAFQVYRVPDRLSHRALDETAQWLVTHRPDHRKVCPLLTDDVTEYVVASHHGWPTYAERIPRLSPLLAIESKQELAEFLGTSCHPGVLVAHPPEVSYDSWVAQSSGHWKSGLAAHWLGEPFGREGEKWLRELGWKETPVPPYYSLFERPESSPN